MGFNINSDSSSSGISNTYISLQNENSVYDYIENMEPLQVFTYVGILILALYTFQFFNITLTHIAAIIIGLVIVFYYNMRDKRNYETKMNDLYHKLHMIHPKPKYFHMDSDIIELIDDIKEYSEYNIIAWSRMIYALDNFLEIVHDMELGVKDFADNVDTAKHQKQLAIDQLQTILFKLPVNRKIEYKLERAIYSMNLILQRRVDAMIHQIQNDIKENGFHTRTKMYYFDEPKGIDMNNDKDRKYLNY